MEMDLSPAERWGWAFASWRQGAGHSQAWVAKRLGWAPSVVSRMEAGTVSPTLETVLFVAEVLRLAVRIEGARLRLRGLTDEFGPLTDVDDLEPESERDVR